MAIATLLGGLVQLLVQWPSLRREGFRYRPALDLRDPGLHRMLLLMGPGTIGLAATQLNLFVSTLLATEPGHGRRVVAAVRLSRDVPAARPVRRLDRDRGAAGGRASRGDARSHGASVDTSRAASR